MFSVPPMLVVGCSSKTDTRFLPSIFPFGGIPSAAIFSAEISPLGLNAAPVTPVPLVPPLDPYVSPLKYSHMPPSSSNMYFEYDTLCYLMSNMSSSVSLPLSTAHIALPSSYIQSLL